jgi:hypothetical protein
VGLAPLVALQAHCTDGLSHPLAHLLALHAEVLEPERDVVLDEWGDEPVLGVLEEHPDPAAHQIGLGCRVESSHADLA